MSTQPTPLHSFHWYDQCVATLRGHVANTRTVDWETVQAFDSVHDAHREHLKRSIATAPELLSALREIAERGPMEGYTSAAALRLRLVATQSIARVAIAKAEGFVNPSEL